MTDNHQRSHDPRLVQSGVLRPDDFGYQKTPPCGPFVQMLHGLVPLRMVELRPYPDAELRAMTAGLADIVASQGDIAQYGGGKTKAGRADAGKARHAIVTAIAILALTQPGGVSIFGGHWCAEPPCILCPTRPAGTATAEDNIEEIIAAIQAGSQAEGGAA